MDVIRLHDLNFRTYIPSETIRQRIREMAAKLNHDLKHEKPLFIGILNGVFVFASELMQELTIECEITFVKLSSYNGTSSTGAVKKIIGLNNDLRGRNVVILEDIIDTGNTVKEFLQHLKTLHPESIRVATLLFKPDALENDLEINYIGFKVPNEFLVGFGLDYDGLGRNLRDIYVRI
ncbi:MAG TPA: hypoxanthine phosphoribosyltransferase [Chitinophagales bacterium]|nr:hypoxanthine phosphoribosyltransferase [Chitinophagales bacterium]